MRRLGGLLILISFACAGCSQSSKVDLPYLGSDARILAFGDSLTFGTGAKQEESYPAVLGGLIGRDVINMGTPGDETSHGLKKLGPALDSIQPDLLILCLGGNDFLRKRPAATIRQNLETLIEQAKQREVPTILLGVPEPAIIAMDAHPMYEELAKKHDLVLENDILSEVLSDGDTKSDLIHPNKQGYRMVAEALAELLRKAGSI